MQRLLHLVILLFISINLFAQAPNKMTYQAVIRNASNNLVVNAPVKMKISILQGSISGTAVYSELHNPTTNANGLVSIEIGSGTSPVGTIGSINWGNGTYFLKTETDPTNGTNYSIVGTSQLLSVPYALQANCVSSSLSGDTLLVGCKKYLIPGIKDLNPPPTLNNGLVGYWPFNGNANDESGNNNNGVVNGATLTTDRFGVTNKAYSFDGFSYIDCGTSQSLNCITGVSISCWGKTSQLYNNCGAVGRWNNNGQYGQEQYVLWFTPNNVQAAIRSDNFQEGNYAVGNFSYNDNKWHHYTISYDQSFSRIYIDGILISQFEQVGFIPSFSQPFTIGTYSIGIPSNKWSGQLDDIRVYNRALTQEEITYLSNN